MKKRMISLALAALMTTGSASVAFAAEVPAAPAKEGAPVQTAQAAQTEEAAVTAIDQNGEPEGEASESAALPDEILVAEEEDPASAGEAYPDGQDAASALESSDASESTDASNEASDPALADGAVLTMDQEETEEPDAELPRAAATSISPNGSYSGSLTSSVSEREYKLTLLTAGRLTINVHSNITKVEVNLYPSDGSNNDYNYMDKGDESYTYDLAAGSYTLKFERYSSSNTGSYTFRTSFSSAGETYTYENNTFNAIRNKDALPFNKKITGQIAYNDQYDYYKIVLPGSGRITVPVYSGMNKLEFDLYDSDENSIDYNYMDKGNETFTYDLKAGTYYLLFERHSRSDTGVYNFTVKYKASGETYTYENDTINAVRGKASIPIGKKILGQVARNDIYDYYKLVIPKKARYTISLSVSPKEIEFSLLNSSDVSLTHNYVDKGTASYRYDLSAGTYYVKIERYSSTYTGNYSFTVKPTGTSISKLSKGKKSFTVKWSRANASGYQIQYSTDKKFKKNCKTVTVKKAGTTKKTVKKLKAKKKYYVRIRTFVKGNGKTYYSGWSKAKTVKTK